MLEIDWNTIGQWASGVAGVVTLIFVAVQSALKRARGIADAAPPPVQNTRIITGDTVAMQALASTLEAVIVVITENNALRRQETDGRRALCEALEENTKASERTRDQIAEARTDVRDLSREIVKFGRS